MAKNFLEQLIAEWYELQGYFIRKNVLVGKRPKGGYECELDVVAFNPEKKHIIQIEPSTDAYSWSKREQRYKKKFKAGKKHIPQLFRGLDIPKKIEQVALFGAVKRTSHKKIAGARIMTVNELLHEITENLKTKSTSSNAVPEYYIILRTVQYVMNSIKKTD